MNKTSPPVAASDAITHTTPSPIPRPAARTAMSVTARGTATPATTWYAPGPVPGGFGSFAAA